MERVSSMKSCPTMQGDLDFVKSVTDSSYLTMNKSRVVCYCGLRILR